MVPDLHVLYVREVVTHFICIHSGQRVLRVHWNWVYGWFQKIWIPTWLVVEHLHGATQVLRLLSSQAGNLPQVSKIKKNDIARKGRVGRKKPTISADNFWIKINRKKTWFIAKNCLFLKNCLFWKTVYFEKLFIFVLKIGLFSG